MVHVLDWSHPENCESYFCGYLCERCDAKADERRPVINIFGFHLSGNMMVN